MKFIECPYTHEVFDSDLCRHCNTKETECPKWQSSDSIKEPENEKRKVIIGGTYLHFKGHVVKVMGLAEHTETGEKMVLYYHLAESFKLWVRPEKMFLSKVDKEQYPDSDQEYRFELLKR